MLKIQLSHFLKISLTVIISVFTYLFWNIKHFKYKKSAHKISNFIYNWDEIYVQILLYLFQIFFSRFLKKECKDSQTPTLFPYHHPHPCYSPLAHVPSDHCPTPNSKCSWVTLAPCICDILSVLLHLSVQSSHSVVSDSLQRHGLQQ